MLSSYIRISRPVAVVSHQGVPSLAARRQDREFSFNILPSHDKTSAMETTARLL